MKKTTRLFLVGLIASYGTAFGQSFQRADIPFSKNGDVFENALTGGLNNPQFSEADFNNDGTPDLYIFDRNGNVHLTFLNDGTPNEPSYTFAPEYARNFPYCHDWVLLRDYNNDGAMDIFTHYTGAFKGMRVFRGFYNADNELDFEVFNFYNNPYNAVYYEQINGNLTNLNITQIDYPVIDDINGDGDLDVLSFSIAGSYVEYYENRSVEY
ncbi:MAG: VCBS repeat-containing protein, partial [Phaeodactylibacter sp.]|nr:VCBS repeat-containing protein [Phaeodactylibacter sp.]